MRIREIIIENYGPVKKFYRKCHDVELVYGSNETGKTALIDALTTALFQKRSIFDGQDRFHDSLLQGESRITVIVEDLGRDYIFPGQHKFEKIINLPHYHLARLFIIRAGDLSLREDRKWQDKVKEFLSGIPVNVEKIKEKIGEEVGLTPGGDWSDRRAIRRKSEIEEKRKRREELLAAIERLKEIREKEKKLKEKSEKKAFLKQKLEKIKLFKAYKKNQQIKKAYSNWLKNSEILEKYHRYDEEDLKTWKEKENQFKALLSDQKSKREYLEQLKEELKRKERELSNLGMEKENLLKEKDRILRLSLIQEVKEILARRNTALSNIINLIYLSFFGAVLAGISLFFLLKNLWKSGSLVLMGAGALILIFVFVTNVKNLNLKKREENTLMKGREIWPDCRSLTEFLERYDHLNSKISQIEAKIQYLIGDKEKIFLQQQRKEEELNIIKSEIETTLDEIKKMKNKTGLFSVAEFEDKMRQKKDILNRIKLAERELETLIETSDSKLWKKEAERKLSPPDGAEELGTEEDLEKELNWLTDEIEDLSRQISSFVGGELGRLNIKEPTQIWRELQEIEDTLSFYQEEKEAAFLAWEILDGVGQDMDKVFVETLLDEKGGVSFYFCKITSGEYRKVIWESGNIFVERKDGSRFSVDRLSSGTQDQLFFSLRLGILKRALSRAAFLLLDDPFLTSDTKRKKEQVGVCQRLRDEGWQIFYFTVDEQLRDIFCHRFNIEPVILG